MKVPRYKVEIAWNDEREQPNDFVPYHQTEEKAKSWATEYAKKTGAKYFAIYLVGPAITISVYVSEKLNGKGA